MIGSLSQTSGVTAFNASVSPVPLGKPSTSTRKNRVIRVIRVLPRKKEREREREEVIVVAVDVCVREPIMDPLLDVCVREPSHGPTSGMLAPVTEYIDFALANQSVTST